MYISKSQQLLLAEFFIIVMNGSRIYCSQMRKLCTSGRNCTGVLHYHTNGPKQWTRTEKFRQKLTAA